MSIFSKNLNFRERHKIQIISNSVALPQEPYIEFITSSCCCCGTILQHPINICKFRCSVCYVTVVLKGITPNREPTGPFKLDEIKSLIAFCNEHYLELDKSEKHIKKHHVFYPVEEYIASRLMSIFPLNSSFETKNPNKIMNYEEVEEFYRLLMELPTKKPFHTFLLASNELLKRPQVSLASLSSGESKQKRLRAYRWILIILEVPSFKQTLANVEAKCNTPQFRAISYEVLKKVIGYLSCLDIPTAKELVHYLKHLGNEAFVSKIELINMYITFHFTRILHNLGKNLSHAIMSPQIEDFQSSQKLNPALANGTRRINRANMNSFFTGFVKPITSGGAKETLNADFKFKPEEYSDDWHIKTGAKFLLLFYVVNQAVYKCPCSTFYNTMLDFVDYKKDFEIWQKSSTKSIDQDKENNNMSLVANSGPFTICQCPFLFSLGMKISILEYETRRLMEYSAEQAFLKALDRKQVVDVYLKIRIRRNFVTQDSLLGIQAQQKDLKKSLRIEFVNEPGIDAGGLRKEWFLLLTRDLFNPNNGLFVYVAQSRLSWFSITSSMNPELLQGQNNSLELYYLFGLVLGLAIYNSTILDLKFPRALYKKLCGENLSVNDFLELYPETGGNLLKMLEYDGDDFEDLFCLTFETSFSDCLNENVVHYQELCENGRNRPVTQHNKHEFFKLWMDFYLNKSIEASFESFKCGFFHVIEGNTFQLFGSEEVEQLVCGSNEQNLDVDMLRSVTKYQGGFEDTTPVVNWFWEILQEFDYSKQRKLLQFVTGSDRVPATGVTTIPFRISKLKSGADRLPISHTCFNEICLYEYETKEMLREKILIAIEESEGYGFR
ncbi:HDL138Wp [Eremothecium sinecaudum]|uniref:HECT-type E3 ubiquitin transferase n=1 Tax=Eremothecium sinecaudum TaxID=45286 RepID=A0A0X8HRF7_9SACH|nr:HDL138Wp [Eremothecium sinecaudum]AMD20606.1 HDL138Wp [Eremothecium sinecaudum]